MGGLQRLFLRITPIFMLICFICFGITHTFQQAGEQNITYMSEIYYDSTNFQPIDNPTPEQKESAIKTYEFDTQSYISNIDIDILKRATTNIVNTENFTATLDAFNNIWKDGYNLLDIVRTLGNGILLVVNTLIATINILIMPLRIIAGILLTGFSIVGININRQTIIVNSLNAILDMGAIPFIRPIYNADSTTLDNSTYQFDNQILYRNTAHSTERFDVEFTAYDNNTTFIAIQTHSNLGAWKNRTIDFIYLDNGNETSLRVYENDQWRNQNYRLITFAQQTINQQQYNSLMNFLMWTAQKKPNGYTNYELLGSEWMWGLNNLDASSIINTGKVSVNFYHMLEPNAHYTAFELSTNNGGELRYYYMEGNTEQSIVVFQYNYDPSGWVYPVSIYIVIDTNNDLTIAEKDYIKSILEQYATLES